MDLAHFPAARATRGTPPGLVRVESGGALPAPVSYAPVVERTIALIYDSSTNYTRNLATTDGGVTYPVLDAAARLPRTVAGLAPYQGLAQCQTMVDYLIAQNPDIEIYFYRNVTEIETTVRSYTFEGFTNQGKCDVVHGSDDWWLRKADDTRTTTAYGWGVNYSLNVGDDAGSRNYAEWYADYSDSLEIRGTLPGKLAGWFCDNTKVYPDNTAGNTSTADWAQNGVNLAWDSATVIGYMRAGHHAFIERQKANQPSFKFIGNSEINATRAAALYTGVLSGYLDGGMFEHGLSNSASWHDLGGVGWSTVFSKYKTLTGYMNSNKMLMMHGRMNTTTDWARARLVVCTGLLGDGIIYVDGNALGPYAGAPTYPDEFDVELGTAIDPAPVIATSGNIWTRRYQNGIVVVNGASTFVDVPYNYEAGSAETYYPPAGIYKRFSGTQDAAHNNGAVVGAGGLAVDGWDGYILLCVTPGVHA